MVRFLTVFALLLLSQARVLAQTEVVSLRELGGGEAALRSALAAGKSVDLSGLTVATTSTLTIKGGQTLMNGTIDASGLTSGAAIVLTNGLGDGGMPSWRPLERLIVRVYPSPRHNVHSSSTDGIVFSGMNMTISNVTVQGARRAWVIDRGAWSIQINDSMAWYNGEGLNCTAPEGGGAGIRLNHVEFAHNNYAVFNKLCEITIDDGSFDSAVDGYIRDNITSDEGTHNSLFICNRCRFEGGGNAKLPWITNSGYMVLRDPLLYEGGTCAYLVVNSGELEITGGFSRLRSRLVAEEPQATTAGCGLGRTYSATGSGRITARGLRPVEPHVPPLRFTPYTSGVRNSDFEQGVDGFHSTVINTLLVDSDNKHDGRLSLQYRSNNANSLLISDPIRVSSEANSFQFSLYFMTRMANGMLLGTFEFFSLDGNSIGKVDADLSNQANWKFARWTGAIPEGAAYARLYVRWTDLNRGAGAVLNLDDLYYTEW